MTDDLMHSCIDRIAAVLEAGNRFRDGFDKRFDSSTDCIWTKRNHHLKSYMAQVIDEEQIAVMREEYRRYLNSCMDTTKDESC